MTEKGFLVRLVELDQTRTKEIQTLGYFFSIDENKESVEKRVKDNLPDNVIHSPRYDFIIKEVQNVYGIYKLGRLR